MNRLQLTLDSGMTISLPANWLIGWDDCDFITKCYKKEGELEFFRIPNGPIKIVQIQTSSSIAKKDGNTVMTVKSSFHCYRYLVDMGWGKLPSNLFWQECLAPEYTTQLDIRFRGSV